MNCDSKYKTFLHKTNIHGLLKHGWIVKIKFNLKILLSWYGGLAMPISW